MAHKVALGALVLALGLPANALAVDRYVDDGGSDTPGCTNPSAPCETINFAVGASSDDDVIHIGAGNYPNANVDTNKRLIFEGAGAAAPDAFDGTQHTRLTGDAGFSALSLGGGGTVRNLIAVGASFAATGDRTPGLNLFAPVGTSPLDFRVENVTAVGGFNPTASDSSEPGILVNAGARPTRVSVENTRLHAPEFGSNLKANGSGAAVTLLRSSLSSGPGTAEVGLDVQAGASVTATELQVDPASEFDYLGFVRLGGGHLRVERSRLVSPDGFRGIVSAGNARLELIDTLIAATDNIGGAAVSLSANAGEQSTASLQGSTVISRTFEGAALLLNSASGMVSVDSVNSAFLGIDTEAPFDSQDVSVQGDATFTARNSAYSVLSVEPGSNGTPAGSGTNVMGDPLFVNALANDFLLHPASPLIDRGDPAAVVAGQVDAAGTPRSLDGNRDCVAAPDIGAFELAGFEAPCPPAKDAKGSVARLSRRSVRLDRRGRIPVLVECDRAEPDPCAGTLALSTRVPGSIAQRRRRARTVRLGAKRFSIAPGKRARVLVKLSRRNRARLRRMKRMRVTGVATLRDPAGNASTARGTFTLRPAKPRKRKRR